MRLIAVTVVTLSGLVPAATTVPDPTGSRSGGDPLVVFATGNAAAPVTRAARLYQSRTGQPVTVVYGGGLATQLEFGAAADVVVTDGAAPIERLRVRNRVFGGSERILPAEPLVLVARPDAGIPSLAGLGRGAAVRLATVSEASAAGVAARQALAAAGAWDAVQDRLVLTEDGRQAVGYVEAGAADLALVPAGALPPGSSLRFTVVVSDSTFRPSAAIVRGTTRLGAARRFIELLAPPAR